MRVLKRNILNLFICVLLIAMSVTMANAFRNRDFDSMKAGVYKCPYHEVSKYTMSTSETCVLEITKTSMSLSHCPEDSEVVKMIEEGKCNYTPDTHMYYSCHYPQGSCMIETNQYGKDRSVSCMGDIDILQVKEDFNAGKCFRE